MKTISTTDTAILVRAEFVRECAMKLFVQEAGITKEPLNKLMTKCLQRADEFASMTESYKGGEINFEKCSANVIIEQIQANNQLTQNLFGQMQSNIGSMASEMSQATQSMAQANSENQNAISSLESKNDEIINKINTINNSIGNINTSIDNINTSIDDINNKIGELPEDKSIGECITDIQTQIDDLNTPTETPNTDESGDSESTENSGEIEQP